MKEIVRSSGGGRLKKSKDVSDGSRGSGHLKKSKSKDAGDGSRVCDRLKKSQDVGDGSSGGDVGGGCREGSLSFSFKSKVLITESSFMYVDDCDDGLPFGKRALYYYHPEDSEVVQKMYGLATEAELARLVESMREKDEDIVSPNLRFSYGAKPYTRDSDPRIGDSALLKEDILHMARASDRAAISRPLKKRHPQSNSLLPSKPVLKSALPKRSLGEIWRKRFEMWEDQEEELLNACDLKMATRGLACFNLKFKTDYMVEEVLGSQSIPVRGCFFHCNFLARSKKDSQQCLFFAELQNAVDVHLCCILDDNNVRGCNFCGKEFVHPSVKGLTTTVGM